MNLFWILPCVFLSIGYRNSRSFNIVAHCPLRQLKWNQRAVERNCTQNTAYHCMQISNGQLAEVCIDTLALDPKDGCPLLGNEKFAFKVAGYFHCSESTGCPVIGERLYPSDELYRYPACLRGHIDIQLSVVSETTVQRTEAERTSTVLRKSGQPFLENLSRSSPRLKTIHTTSLIEEADQVASLAVYGIALGGIIAFLLLLMISLVITAAILGKKSTSRNVQAGESAVGGETEDEEENQYDYVDIEDLNDIENYETNE